MSIGITAAAVLLLLVGGGVLLIAFLRGRAEYAELIESLDEKDFKLKSLLPAGLYLADTFSPAERLPGGLREYLYRYNGRINAQIAEIYGIRERDFYAELHVANKWVVSLLVFMFMALFALIECSSGEYSTALVLVLAAILALAAMPFVMDRELANKIEQRRDQLLLEFPEFINKLILLVNAGSTIPKAWEKIVAESKSTSPLFRELRFCHAEIQAGKPEAVAYEEFARRCKIKEAIKFVSVVILNLRKGGAEVVPTLKAQADECWEARRAAARRLGEKASSKLMLPMSIMLLGIIMVVALPAVLALTGM